MDITCICKAELKMLEDNAAWHDAMVVFPEGAILKQRLKAAKLIRDQEEKYKELSEAVNSRQCTMSAQGRCNISSNCNMMLVPKEWVDKLDSLMLAHSKSSTGGT